MDADEVQRLRDFLRASIARFANGTEQDGGEIAVWADIADALTTLGFDSPLLVELIVYRDQTKNHHQIACRLIEDLELRPLDLMNPVVALHALSATRAREVIGIQDPVALYEFICNWISFTIDCSRAAKVAASDTDPDWYINFLELLGLPWIQKASSDLMDLLFVLRTGGGSVHLELLSGRIDGVQEADDASAVLATVIHDTCRGYIDGLPSEITGPA